MKNLHVLPTDKPSRLFIHNAFNDLRIDNLERLHNNNQNIYITSDEKIKEVDKWIYNIHWDEPQKIEEDWVLKILNESSNTFKIILTTDQDLIADGVQAIDDTFLEWFVKNPSCEEVEVGYGWIRLTETDNEGYWVSIPNKQFEMQQEEPKQETLEEAAENYGWRIKTNSFSDRVKANELAESAKQDFIAGAKWQQERMYSEEEVFNLCREFAIFVQRTRPSYKKQQEWFEQFKKK